VLNRSFEGYNCSLFAYGQTGSGKSYSMVGYGADKGIIPMCCERIFERIASETAGAAAATAGGVTCSYRVEASMLEIYMEKCVRCRRRRQRRCNFTPRPAHAPRYR